MIIDRYIKREIDTPLVILILILVSIFLTFSLTRFLTTANAGLIQGSEVLSLSLLRALISLEVLIPLCFYLAVMFGLGRLYSDSEIYAMRSGGISEKRLLRPVVGLALLLAILVGLLSMFVRPWAYEASYEIKARAEGMTEVDRIRAARFYSFEETDRTIFIKAMESSGDLLTGVFIRSMQQGKLQVITAPSGKLLIEQRPGYHQLVLQDAGIYTRNPTGADFHAELGTFSIWVPSSRPFSVDYKIKASSTFDLIHSVDSYEIGEFQWRLSTPLSVLLLGLLAIPLSRSQPRRGRYVRMLSAVIIYAVYFNLLDVSRTWVEIGTARGIWWVPGLLAIVTATLWIPWQKVRMRFAGG